MLGLQEVALFALTTFVLMLTPGPNMIYCVSRALSQGRAAGMVSLAGISGFLARNRGWLRAQRILMGTMLGALAARMALADPK